ncbi:hypothetical protein TNCV_1650141 [Trichonephila clavipes]|nr:hypothetical protein TNCV_1650141 [Trichonephila clavipes]
MATDSYLTPNYSRSQSEIQGDLHKACLGAEHWEFSRQTDLLTRTSSHAPQSPRSRILNLAQWASALMGCRATELSY